MSSSDEAIAGFATVRAALRRRRARERARGLGHEQNGPAEDAADLRRPGSGAADAPPMDFHINYRDASGSFSSRNVTLLSATPTAGGRDVDLVAFCHLRGEERTFLASRVLQLVDLATGEAPPDPVAYFLAHPLLAGETPEALLVREWRHELILLTVAAALDGAVGREEEDAIVAFLERVRADGRIDRERLRSLLRLFSPTGSQVLRSLERLERRPGAHGAFLGALEEVTAADGHVDEAEREFVAAIRRRLDPARPPSSPASPIRKGGGRGCLWVSVAALGLLAIGGALAWLGRGPGSAGPAVHLSPQEEALAFIEFGTALQRSVALCDALGAEASLAQGLGNVYALYDAAKKAGEGCDGAWSQAYNLAVPDGVDDATGALLRKLREDCSLGLFEKRDAYRKWAKAANGGLAPADVADARDGLADAERAHDACEAEFRSVGQALDAPPPSEFGDNQPSPPAEPTPDAPPEPAENATAPATAPTVEATRPTEATSAVNATAEPGDSTSTNSDAAPPY
ncbi:MAG TPA: hypothetical protein VGS12_13425 [Caulobacteraceae bacterium]|nr:hypothetical protein [Caulobacteraceae bacterium]